MTYYKHTEYQFTSSFFGDYNGMNFYLAGCQKSWRAIIARGGFQDVLGVCGIADFVVRHLVFFHSVHRTWIGNQSRAEVREFPVLWHYDGISVHKWCPPLLLNRLWFPVCSGALCCWILDDIRVELWIPFKKGSLDDLPGRWSDCVNSGAVLDCGGREFSHSAWNLVKSFG